MKKLILLAVLASSLVSCSYVPDYRPTNVTFTADDGINYTVCVSQFGEKIIVETNTLKAKR